MPTARAERAGPADPSRRARGSPRWSASTNSAWPPRRRGEMSFDRRILLLEQAYQGRAMFVKVSCKAGESPVELSHRPELRFRFIPRPHDGAPLIANAVQFEVRLARTRAPNVLEANGMKSTPRALNAEKPEARGRAYLRRGGTPHD